MKKELKTKKSLSNSKQMFRLLFENSADGILIGFSDGAVTAANPSACRMFDRSEEEICHIGSKKLIDPEDSRRFLFFKKLSRSSDVQSELLFLKKDGAKFHGEVSSFELGDETDSKRVLFIIRDLTELNQTDEALRKLNQKIYTVLAKTTDIYISYDRDRRIIDLNQKAEIVIGKKRDEIIGKYMWEVLPFEKNSEYLRKGQNAIETQTLVYSEACPIFGRWYESYGYPLEDGLLVYGRDITERVLSEEQLRLKTENLEEVNTALKVLLRQLEEDKMDLKAKILSNIRELVLPHVNNLKKGNPSARQLSLLNIVEANLNTITSSFLQQLKLQYYNLTPREIEVATHVKEGRSIKEIAELLAISIGAVEFHRISLRKKLGLKDKRANLRLHLLSLQ